MKPDVLPAWLQSQLSALCAQRGHAYLLAGAAGLGQLALAQALVLAWLCDRPTPHGACGSCTSCRALASHTHPDFFLLAPEDVCLAQGWPLDERAQDDIDSQKRKPSREIKVEALRELIAFTQRTGAWARGRCVLVYPAERLNAVSGNALLKTLEEPAPGLRFVLATQAIQQLLPTVRSRCQTVRLPWPDPAQAQAWLMDAQHCSAEQALTALRAAGGRPYAALAQAVPPERWTRLPEALRHGDVAFFKDMPSAQVLDALHKLCHDLLVHHWGGQPRFFDVADLPSGADPQRLVPWSVQLRERWRTVDHPYNAGLMLEDLVLQGQWAVGPGTSHHRLS